MAQKKKEPRLRLKRVKQNPLKDLFFTSYVLQEWSETQNKYVDVPTVD